MKFGTPDALHIASRSLMPIFRGDHVPMSESVSNHAGKSRPTHRRSSVIYIVLAGVLFLFGLALLIAPRRDHGPNHRENIVRIQIDAIKGSLHAFNQDAGRFPTTAEGLAALIARPKGLTESQWRGPYLDELPRDAFGRDFHYAYPSVHGRPFDLGSSGRDKTWGTPDDITNAPSR